MYYILDSIIMISVLAGTSLFSKPHLSKYCTTIPLYSQLASEFAPKYRATHHPNLTGTTQAYSPPNYLLNPRYVCTIYSVCSTADEGNFYYYLPYFPFYYSFVSYRYNPKSTVQEWDPSKPEIPSTFAPRGVLTGPEKK